MSKRDEFIWDDDYVRNLIQELNDESTVLNQIIEDNKETFDEWENEESIKDMIDLTNEQISILKTKTTETYIFTDNYRGDREFDPFTIEYSNEDEKFEQLIDYFIGSTNCIEECYGLDDIKDLSDYDHIMELISIEEEGNNFLIEIEDGEYTTEYNGQRETWSIEEDSLYCKRIS